MLQVFGKPVLFVAHQQTFFYDNFNKQIPLRIQNVCYKFWKIRNMKFFATINGKKKHCFAILAEF